ncbi:MAG: hypothetical protein SFU53_13220 [Terrimicrobiaceae bacterium]|nr:hypothetical protein [Terrimicrobiaceae bacterium]
MKFVLFVILALFSLEFVASGYEPLFTFSGKIDGKPVSTNAYAESIQSKLGWNLISEPPLSPLQAVNHATELVDDISRPTVFSPSDVALIRVENTNQWFYAITFSANQSLESPKSMFDNRFVVVVSFDGKVTLPSFQER